MTAPTLTAVARAARRREQADRAYVQAIEQARGAGYSHADIGRAVGVSRQAIRQLLISRTAGGTNRLEDA